MTLSGENVWQKQIEEILRKKFSEPELSRKVAQASELVKLVQAVEIPEGETGELVASMLRLVSNDLQPLAAVYAGFQLGIAFERYQNANQTKRE